MTYDKSLVGFVCIFTGHIRPKQSNMSNISKIAPRRFRKYKIKTESVTQTRYLMCSLSFSPILKKYVKKKNQKFTSNTPTRENVRPATTSDDVDDRSDISGRKMIYRLGKKAQIIVKPIDPSFRFG